MIKIRMHSASGGLAPPSSMEVTSEDAISSLRSHISSGQGKGPDYVALAWNFFVASAEASLIMLFASPVFMMLAVFYGLGIGAGAFLLCGFLLWVVLLRGRLKKEGPVVKSGIAIGDSYMRHVLVGLREKVKRVWPLRAPHYCPVGLPLSLRRGAV